MQAKDVTITAQSFDSAAEPRAQPFLFLVFQSDQPLASSLRISLANVSRVRIGRAQARSVERVDADVIAIGLADRSVSSTHAELRKLVAGWALSDPGSKNGTFVNGARAQDLILEDGDWIETGNVFFRFRLAVPGDKITAILDSNSFVPAAPGLSTFVPALATAFAKLALVADSKIPISLGGESGAGKEVLARAIHTLSRRPGPFVPVNCGAISPTLLESELFGYRKGAFSGALEDRPGLVRTADRGTLFLDEIGDLPLPAQATLLRVLQESEVLPVGGTRAVKVDLRLVAATHRDLGQLVTQGTFRQDLLARISGFVLRLPPLRERAEDLGLIIAELLRRHFPNRDQLVFAPAAARELLNCEWPLNVRELEKVLRAAVVLANGGAVERAHLAELLPRTQHSDGEKVAHAPRTPVELSEEDQALRAKLVLLFEEHGGNISAVAVAIGKRASRCSAGSGGWRSIRARTASRHARPAVAPHLPQVAGKLYPLTTP